MTGRRLLIWLVSAVVLLEVVLQCGALWVAWTTEDRAQLGRRAKSDEPVVLCVGDSFTYGIGADDASQSYPVQLEKELRASGTAVRVVNAGLSGQNSSDVLRKIDAQLALEKPRVVCVLVGTNDRWRLADQLTAAELDAAAAARTAEDVAEDAAHGFVWRWRTGRLIDWALGAPEVERGVRAVQVAPRVRHASVFGAFTRRVQDPTRKPRLQPNGRYEPGPVWALVGRGEHEAAIRLARAALELGPSNPHSLYQLIASSSIKLGRRDDAARAVAELERLFAERPDNRFVAKSLLIAVSLLDDRARTRELGAYCEREFPTMRETYWAQLRLFAVSRELEAAERAKEGYLASDEPEESGQRARMYRTMARVWAGTDRDKVMEYVLLGLAAGGDDEGLKTRIRGSLRRYPVAKARAAAKRFLEDDGERARVLAIVEPVLGEDLSAFAPVLADNLRLIVERVRSAGAEPVLLTYPYTSKVVADVQRGAAEASKVKLADCEAFFEALRGEMSREAFKARWFAPDWHCNGLGYGEMVRCVAPVVRAALKR